MSFIFLLFACETVGNYNANLNRWVGKPEKNLIYVWGEPNSIFKLGQNEEIITYIKKDRVIVPPQITMYDPDFNNVDTLYAPFSYDEDFTLPLSESNGYIVNNICRTSFHIKDGIVQSWQWKGNDCVAF